MTNAEVLQLTIRRCNEIVERQLAETEVMLVDLGATGEEIKDALDSARRSFEAERDAQIASVTRWLTLGDEKLH